MFFVTNNSTKSRAGYLKKFTDLGLSVKAEEIYSSSYAAAAYLDSINFKKKASAAGGRGGGGRRAGRTDGVSEGREGEGPSRARVRDRARVCAPMSYECNLCVPSVCVCVQPVYLVYSPTSFPCLFLLLSLAPSPRRLLYPVCLALMPRPAPW